MLAGYNYTTEYHEGKSNKNSVALNRLPLTGTVNVIGNPAEIMFI